MKNSVLAAIAVLVVSFPAISQAQTVTVQAEATVPAPPPAQPAPQQQVVVQQPAPQPYVQPQPQPYYQPQPAPVAPPRQQLTRSHPIWGLVIPGAVVLGVSWILHAALVSPLAGLESGGLNPDWGTFRWLGVVPVLGPWMQMAAKPGSLDQDSWAGYLAVDGLLQAGGLTMLILGLALQETETYYAEGGDGGPDFAILPTAGQNGGGLQAVGRF